MRRPSSTSTPSLLLVLLVLSLLLSLSPALETKDFKTAASDAVEAVEEAAAAALHAVGDAATAAGHAASHLLHSAESAAEDMLEAVESAIAPDHASSSLPSSSSLSVVYFGMPFTLDSINFSEESGVGTTVGSLKTRIEKEYKIPASEQMVFHEGIMLDNGVTLGSKKIGPDSKVEVRHKIAIKEGTKMPTGKQGFSPEEMKELFNIDLTSFRTLWEAKQEAGKEGLKEGKGLLKEKKNQIKAFVGMIGDFFKGLGRKVKEEVSKLRKTVAGWRKGGRKDVPLLKKAGQEL